MQQIDAVDLFCGAGGLTRGLLNTGISVRAGYDIDLNCEHAYSRNNDGAQFVAQSVELVKVEDVAAWYRPGRIKLLAGCAPCQPFSTYNQGRDTTTDRKWPLLYSFKKLIEEIQPELVTMENVPDVTKHKVYHDFVESLQGKYEIWQGTIHCVDYGLPQQRKRHVLLASKLGPISMIPKTHSEPVSVEKAIGHLPKIIAGKCHPQDPLHRAATLSPINLERIRASEPGGTWRDWPEDLRAPCHRKASGKTYLSVYGRMRGNEPGPTMTTLCYGFGNGRFGHYDTKQDRAISLREAAILQSFPDDYEFMPANQITFKAVGRMIGNAVPVRLGEIIGLSIQRHLEDVQKAQQEVQIPV